MTETTTTPTEFQKMLAKFHRIIENEPPVSQVKDQLEKLSEFAKKSAHLNSRQTDAVMARCDNYTNGLYGKTKSKENMNYQNQ